MGQSFLAEMMGTALLILLGDGVVAGVLLKHSKAYDGGWIVITVGWAMAVTFGVYLAGQISGAHINPAVTIALAAGGTFPWSDVPVYLAGQFIGAFLGAVLVYIQYLPHWQETEDPGLKLGIFCTAPAIRNTPANFLSELIGTFVLMFGLMAIGANTFADGLNPLIVGGLVLAIGLSLGGTTGYAINPARDLGPRIAHALLPIPGKGGSDWGYAWIPVVGPVIGGTLGVLTYQWLFG
ncbi:MAG TPA: MIP/aquaporin family protein [Saprospiraceae bacterium]|nr:MIP/aquaporin family protein [Saprospiraceae bacterium]HRV86660.1 MIP/aquaporin family protein [Saprospiraceae bacterium]